MLDCDNTIWGGVLAEDGNNNIKLGLASAPISDPEGQRGVTFCGKENLGDFF